LGNTGTSTCGGIFRNADSSFLGAYAFNIGVSTSLKAELLGAIIAIETAANKGWSYLWLKSDMLVVHAFSYARIVPWSLRNHWDKCLLLTSNMNFYVSHIFREGNHCADKLANLGLSLHDIPSVLVDDFDRNRLGMPYYRLC
jgi:ribonuclease HI